jgi:phosphate transport system permease protein
MESPVAEPRLNPTYSAPMTTLAPVSLRPPRPTVARTPAARARREQLIQAVLAFCGIVSILTTAGIVFVLLFEAIEFFREVPLWRFLTDTEWTPLFADKQFGVMVLASATFLTSTIALVVAVPIGLMSAIYLSEVAPRSFRKVVKPLLEVLAGVPTVVYGYFALLFVTPLLQVVFPNISGFNALSAGLVMGVMIIPLVVSLSEDALFAVPQNLRDGAYALGATRLQVATRVVVPAALSGIVASFILAVSRAVGETMIVAIAAGQSPNLTLNPFVPVETMTAYIVQVSLGDTPTGTLEFKTIFAVGMTLFLLTLGLNILSHRLVSRFRERYE